MPDGFGWLERLLYSFPYAPAAFIVALIVVVLLLRAKGRDFTQKPLPEKLRFVSLVLASLTLLVWFIFTRAIVPIYELLAPTQELYIAVMLAQVFGYGFAVLLLVVSLFLPVSRRPSTSDKRTTAL